MPRTPLLALLLFAGAALAQSAPEGPENPETPAPAAPGHAAALRAVAAQQAQPARATWLGVRVAPLDAESRAHFEIPADVAKGVVIAEVIDESPAARAGLRAGDVITSFADEPVTEAGALVTAVRARQPGQMVSYVVRRGDGTIAGTLTLGAWTPEAEEEEGEAEEPEEVEETEEHAGWHEVPSPEHAQGELEERATELRHQIEILQRRTSELRGGGHAAPAGWDAWIDREERALEAARKREDHAGVMVHQVRLDMLRELRDAGTAAPPAPQEAGLRRIERKLDSILELLRERRRPVQLRVEDAGGASGR